MFLFILYVALSSSRISITQREIKKVKFVTVPTRVGKYNLKSVFRYLRSYSISIARCILYNYIPTWNDRTMICCSKLFYAVKSYNTNNTGGTLLF